jgi:hypothetical protein
MITMTQTVCIVLRSAHRERLAAIVSDQGRRRKHIERAQVILASAEGGPSKYLEALGRETGVTPWFCLVQEHQRRRKTGAGKRPSRRVLVPNGRRFSNAADRRAAPWDALTIAIAVERGHQS